LISGGVFVFVCGVLWVQRRKIGGWGRGNIN
jgi:hypothetical protein